MSRRRAICGDGLGSRNLVGLGVIEQGPGSSNKRELGIRKKRGWELEGRTRYIPEEVQELGPEDLESLDLRWFQVQVA